METGAETDTSHALDAMFKRPFSRLSTHAQCPQKDVYTHDGKKLTPRGDYYVQEPPGAERKNFHYVAPNLHLYALQPPLPTLARN